MQTISKKGFSVIEIIIASAVVAVTVTAVVLSIQFYIQLSQKGAHRIQAALLIEETAEALLILRDMGWDAKIEPLNLNTNYYLAWDGENYSATTTNTLVQDFYTRSFKFEEVERDATSDSITESGVVDQNTRQVEISVSWQEKGETKTETSLMLIHNVYQE